MPFFPEYTYIALHDRTFAQTCDVIQKDAFSWQPKIMLEIGFSSRVCTDLMSSAEEDATTVGPGLEVEEQSHAMEDDTPDGTSELIEMLKNEAMEAYRAENFLVAIATLDRLCVLHQEIEESIKDFHDG